MPAAQPAIPCAGTWSAESQTATGRSCSETVNPPSLNSRYDGFMCHVLRVSPLRNVNNKMIDSILGGSDVMAYWVRSN